MPLHSFIYVPPLSLSHYTGRLGKSVLFVAFTIKDEYFDILSIQGVARNQYFDIIVHTGCNRKSI